MSGFALLTQPGTTEPERQQDFNSIMNLTAAFKKLEFPGRQAVGNFCTAVKFDSESALHRGIFKDSNSGSWMLAVGTVVLLDGDNSSGNNLAELLRSYLLNGIEAMRDCDGQFALIIYDARENAVSIISDPMGCFAVYYGLVGSQFVCSTSALAVACQLDAKPDILTIECFLRTGRLYGENTFWQGVKRLPPANLIKITPTRCEKLEYWTPSIDKRVANRSQEDALEEAEEIILRNFKKVLAREGKIWGDLTGGFDSRLVLMYMSKLGIPFAAYCVGPEDHPDVAVSRIVCQEMGWEYHWMPLPQGWAQEQIPWFENALFKGDASLSVFQLAGVLRGQAERSNSYLAHITGTGGDEWHYHQFGASILFPRRKTAPDYDRILDVKILDRIPVNTLRQDRTADVRCALKEYFIRLTANYTECNNASQADIIFIRHRHPTHGGAFLSAESGIMRALIPFCFKELENFSLSLNHWWRIKYHYGFVRNLLERGEPRLANIRTAHGEPALPIRLTNLPKFWPLWKDLTNQVINKVSYRFTSKVLLTKKQNSYCKYPLTGWKTAWLDWAVSEKLLDNSQMRSGVLYNKNTLGELVAESRAGRVDPGEYLDRVITVEMAMRATGASID